MDSFKQGERLVRGRHFHRLRRATGVNAEIYAELVGALTPRVAVHVGLYAAAECLHRNENGFEDVLSPQVLAARAALLLRRLLEVGDAPLQVICTAAGDYGLCDVADDEADGAGELR